MEDVGSLPKPPAPDFTKKEVIAFVVSLCMFISGIAILIVWNVNYYRYNSKPVTEFVHKPVNYFDAAVDSDLSLLKEFNGIIGDNVDRGYKKSMWNGLKAKVDQHRRRQVALTGSEDPDYRFQLALSKYNSAKRNSSANVEIEKKRVQEALISSRLEFMDVAWPKKDYTSRLEAFFAQIDKTANESIGWIPEENFWANYTPGLSASCLIPYPDPVDLVEMYYTAFYIGAFGCSPETTETNNKLYSQDLGMHIFSCIFFLVVVFCCMVIPCSISEDVPGKLRRRLAA
ncbi:hypothetical protein L596_009249 [Steinernema carpocapsae]|uniref:Uncharacterized protein n=1 Tax=Steinernema carpocapsae TaxID=34508 RepID=A0A4U5PF78_STECR|nr:hypothetical protein L596_009249 [Steinernema carpocapsae]